MINSKKKFDNGPSNNKRFNVPLKKKIYFGFVAPEDSKGSNDSGFEDKTNLGKKIFGQRTKSLSSESQVLNSLV